MVTRILLVLVLFTLASPAPALRAAGSAPSEASVKQLIGIMQLRKSLDSLVAQLNKIMETAAEQAAQGKALSDNAKASLDRCRTDVHTLIRDDLAWAKMESVYVQIYQSTFTQDEIDAMIGFYKTPVGQSVVSKLPVAMQKAQNETMQIMQPMMQRIKQMQQEVAAATQPSQ
jgi:hypothetical protein